jgi:hypothetical protein
MDPLLRRPSLASDRGHAWGGGIEKCCGRRTGGDARAGAVLVETPRDRCAVVEKRELSTEAFRVAGPG